MAIVGDVRDELAALAETIGHIRTIAEAVETGRDYVIAKHPQVAEDLAVLCTEMKKSALALALASTIVTNFNFVIGEEQAGSARDFNRALLEHKAKAKLADQAIESMRGHCSVIKEHAEAIGRQAGSGGLMAFASFLGLHSSKREEEIAQALHSVYDEEMEYHAGVNVMADAIRIALWRAPIGWSGFILSA